MCWGSNAKPIIILITFCSQCILLMLKAVLQEIANKLSIGPSLQLSDCWYCTTTGVLRLEPPLKLLRFGNHCIWIRATGTCNLLLLSLLQQLQVMDLSGICLIESHQWSRRRCCCLQEVLELSIGVATETAASKIVADEATTIVGRCWKYGTIWYNTAGVWEPRASLWERWKCCEWGRRRRATFVEPAKRSTIPYVGIVWPLQMKYYVYQ